MEFILTVYSIENVGCYTTSIAICHSVIIRIGALVLGMAIALSVARIRCQIAGFHFVQSTRYCCI